MSHLLRSSRRISHTITRSLTHPSPCTYLLHRTFSTRSSTSLNNTPDAPITRHPTMEDPVGLGPAPPRVPPTRGPRRIQADIRFESGTRIARALREKGMIPGVIFTPRNSHEKVLISVPLRQLQSDMVQGGSMFTRVYHIDVPGYAQPFKVIPKAVAVHTVTDAPLNVSFLEFEENKPIKIKVPIYVYNHTASPALKEGFFMKRPIMSIWCSWCGGDELPAYLLVDVAKLDVERPIVVRDLIFPPGLSAWYKDSAHVLEIDLSDQGEEEQQEEEEAAATGATPAAGATPAGGKAPAAAAGGAKPAAAAAAKPADKKK